MVYKFIGLWSELTKLKEDTWIWRPKKPIKYSLSLETIIKDGYTIK